MLFVGASGNDPKNDFVLFLKTYAWVLCVVVIFLILATIVIVFVVKNRKAPRNKKIESKATPDEWMIALGGKDNILEISSAGSRLSIKIKNRDLVNRDQLTSLGVSSIVLMSDKITLVTNLDNHKIEENIRKCL